MQLPFRNVLVSGGPGFTGSHIREALSAQGIGEDLAGMIDRHDDGSTDIAAAQGLGKYNVWKEGMGK